MSNQSVCITISLPKNLVSEINVKRGHLTKNQACQILLRTALNLVSDSTIPNIATMENHDG
ncbi:MAG: hypothetical protein LVO36_00670 [Nitrosopumilus sp. (ex Thoosa mismalolli)]|nr:hypothetical protein [Nitrosopumilus sp. (ex Thoosa mismalolli)]